STCRPGWTTSHRTDREVCEHGSARRDPECSRRWPAPDEIRLSPCATSPDPRVSGSTHQALCVRRLDRLDPATLCKAARLVDNFPLPVSGNVQYVRLARSPTPLPQPLPSCCAPWPWRLYL